MDRRTCLTLLGAGVSGLAGCSALGRDSETLEEPVDVHLRNRNDSGHTLDLRIMQRGPPGKGDPGYGAVYDERIELLAGAELALSDVIRRPEPFQTVVKIDPESSGRAFNGILQSPNVATGSWNVEITTGTDLEQYFVLSGAGSPLTSPTPTTVERGDECTGANQSDTKRTATVAFEVTMENATETVREGQLFVSHEFCRCHDNDPNCMDYQRAYFLGQYRLEPGEANTRTIHRALTRSIDQYEVTFAVLESEESKEQGRSVASRDSRYGIEKGDAEQFTESTDTETAENPYPRQKDFRVRRGSTTTFSAMISPDGRGRARLEVESE
jgi:Tfp pilus assembly protein PilX